MTLLVDCFFLYVIETPYGAGFAALVQLFGVKNVQFVQPHVGSNALVTESCFGLTTSQKGDLRVVFVLLLLMGEKKNMPVKAQVLGNKCIKIKCVFKFLSSHC